jgi:DNA (cytosine-5)-methyltransferase 1
MSQEHKLIDLYYFKKVTQNKNIIYNKHLKPKLNMIDLCAGTGGFTIAFQNTGKVNVVMANDFCNKSESIYKHNFPDHIFLNKDLININNNNIPNHDIMTAGFPCQSFSISGKQAGFKDKRSQVFWKILDIIKYKTPRFVVLENVKNLQSHDKGKTFEIITTKINELGYYIKHKILNTSDVTDIPQNRERIYIVCFKYKSDYNKFNFDFKTHKSKNIVKYLNKKIDDVFYYSDKVKIWDKLASDVIKHIKTNTVYQYRRYYVRENKSKVCPTLTANMGTGGHNVPIILDNKGIRKLIPRECFNLQGFPSNYKLPKLSNSALYKLAGNAISVPVAKLIANKLVTICHHTLC